MSLVNSFNEWDPLEEIVIGICDNAQFPRFDKSISAIEKINQMDYVQGNYPTFSTKIIEETKEDLSIFETELKKLNIAVRRPESLDKKVTFGNPYWTTNGFYDYCPRDSMLIVGDLIIETPMVLRSRYYETFSYRNLLLNYMKNGARWIAAPKPTLSDDCYNLENKKLLGLNNNEPVFDAANIIRAGQDLFYLISDSGNEMGCQWLQSILGEKYNVHPCYNLYDSVHIDSTIALLRPGLALINDKRVNKDNIPEKLKKWDLIKSPEMIDINFSGKKALSSIFIGMNILMVNPELAVVDERQKPLITLLEKNKINVLPLKLRHSRTLGGGFHCVTLDIRRKGNLENYFT